MIGLRRSLGIFFDRPHPIRLAAPLSRGRLVATRHAAVEGSLFATRIHTRSNKQGTKFKKGSGHERSEMNSPLPQRALRATAGEGRRQANGVRVRRLF